MSQYNKLSDIQYVRFQTLPVDLHFGLFWSAGIPTMIQEKEVILISLFIKAVILLQKK